MFKILFYFLPLYFITGERAMAQDAEMLSPDKQVKLVVSVKNGKMEYSVSYAGKVMLESSPLGLITNEADLSSGMKYLGKEESMVNKTYRNEKIKRSEIHYKGNKLTCMFENAAHQKLNIVFQVSDNNIAFRYELPVWDKHMS